MSPIWALVLAAATGCPDSRVAVPQAAVVEQLAPAVQTGTLLFSQGDCLAVKCFSASRFTHVGMVAQTPAGPMVYDSMNGTGVRKTPLAEYVSLQTPCDLLAVHPAKPISEPQAGKLCEALEQQLGRPYGIRHHLTGSKCEGVHCSEYATECLIAAGLMTASNPARVSPGSLLQGVRQSGLYIDGAEFSLALAPVPEPVGETWCQWSWRCTKTGVLGSCVQMRRWFLCR